MRLVLDTDVLVAAFRSERGASRELLIAALDERYILLASPRCGWSTKRY
ncbi:MAG: PIN domain-containing protein [Pseudomonadota bacterium]|nr:PIN domain-containing protein [Pseudomonadota bacterium]